MKPTFVRPKLKRDILDDILREQGFVLLKMIRFDCLRICQQHGTFLAYFSADDVFKIDHVDSDSGEYKLNLPRKLTDDKPVAWLSWDLLKDD